MSSWISSWLAGPSPVTESDAPVAPPETYRGERLGLPESGPGSVARPGRKLGGFLVDTVFASLITSAFVRPEFLDTHSMQVQNYWSVLTWLVITVIGIAFFGATPGMLLLRIRVARLDGATMVGVWRALVRQVLVALIIPAVIWDIDFRAWHDKAVRTVVVHIN